MLSRELMIDLMTKQEMEEIFLQGIPEGIHYLAILTEKNNLLYCDKFIVPAGVDYHMLEDVISLDATPKPQALDERSCTQTLSINSHPYNVDCIFASQNNTAFDIYLY
jgi:hypothetical protein